MYIKNTVYKYIYILHTFMRKTIYTDKPTET